MSILGSSVEKKSNQIVKLELGKNEVIGFKSVPKHFFDVVGSIS